MRKSPDCGMSRSSARGRSACSSPGSWPRAGSSGRARARRHAVVGSAGERHRRTLGRRAVTAGGLRGYGRQSPFAAPIPVRSAGSQARPRAAKPPAHRPHTAGASRGAARAPRGEAQCRSAARPRGDRIQPGRHRSGCRHPRRRHGEAPASPLSHRLRRRPESGAKHAAIGFSGFTSDEILRIARVTIPADRIVRKRDAFEVAGVGRFTAMRPNLLAAGASRSLPFLFSTAALRRTCIWSAPMRRDVTTSRATPCRSTSSAPASAGARRGPACADAWHPEHVGNSRGGRLPSWPRLPRG